MSMPYLFYHHQPPHTAKKHWRISRSLHKFLRSIFRPKHNHNTTSLIEGPFYVYDTSSALATIPEVPETLPEFDGLSPEMESLVARTVSDQFMPSTSLGISCV
ncbi:hypothetical protein L1987_73557 [Smallanthus sonchifolius]|uniref:Uncharacterized protein n=1 Tax=Smallanthus sonchifolius TaxID=185202 RepID=A0ACB9A0W5_9ASTR|nr:hypothetical protein L1987_73557 [Smallanthus sonchifolius]